MSCPEFTKLESLDGVVVDDSTAKLSGIWTASTLNQGIHHGYQHDSDAGDGHAVAIFTTELPKPATYEVQVAYTTNQNRASKFRGQAKNND